MNEFLKYIGIILIILGAGILGYYFANHITSNGPLLFALFLFVAGMAFHIILNKILE